MRMDASQIQRDFDPVTVDDYPLIQRYLSLEQYEESNHNLVNMILWIDSYPLFSARIETSCFFWACTKARCLLHAAMPSGIFQGSDSGGSDL